MTENSIECPSCGTKISLTDALSADIKEHYKNEFQQISSKREAEMRKLQDMLTQEKKALIHKQAEIETTIQNRLNTERSTLEIKIRGDLTNQTRLEIDDLKLQLNEKAKLVEASQQHELELRKRTRELEDKEKSVELEIQRKLDSERIKIQEETGRKITEDLRLKTAEKDKQLDDMRRQIEDLKRKAEQGSQQSQGEILELEIESILKALFPADIIEPVAKGMRGGDIIQKVMTPSGQHVGTIIWETKRTKGWTDSWITKLKDDQRAISAEHAVIVSQTLPKDINTLAQIDGVWVTDFFTYRGIAVALRSSLTQLFQAKAVAANKGEKMDSLYHYLTGTQFKQRIEAIVESFKLMREDLEKEKRAITKIWATREQQINRVITSTAGMHGDIYGIIGTSLPKIESLEIEEPENSKDDESSI
jgi:hypothetical protein